MPSVALHNCDCMEGMTTCSICEGFGRVHPVSDGKTDYSKAVYCQCHAKAGQEIPGSINHVRDDGYIVANKVGM